MPRPPHSLFATCQPNDVISVLAGPLKCRLAGLICAVHPTVCTAGCICVRTTSKQLIVWLLRHYLLSVSDGGRLRSSVAAETTERSSTAARMFLFTRCVYVSHSGMTTSQQTINTHPFNGPLSGTTRSSQYQKGKTNLDVTEARDNEWQWHQLGHM